MAAGPLQLPVLVLVQQEPEERLALASPTGCLQEQRVRQRQVPVRPRGWSLDPVAPVVRAVLALTVLALTVRHPRDWPPVPAELVALPVPDRPTDWMRERLAQALLASAFVVGRALE